jgi:hypothetical protein
MDRADYPLSKDTAERFMATHLSPAGFVGKWLIAPILIGVLGYYVVGPRFGGQISSKIRESGLNISVPGEKEAAHAYPKPKVTVSSRKVGDAIKPTATSDKGSNRSIERDEPSEPRKRKRRRRRRSTSTRTETRQESSSSSESSEKSSGRKKRSTSDPPPVIPSERNDPPPVIEN